MASPGSRTWGGVGPDRGCGHASCSVMHELIANEDALEIFVQEEVTRQQTKVSVLGKESLREILAYKMRAVQPSFPRSCRVALKVGKGDLSSDVPAKDFKTSFDLSQVVVQLMYLRKKDHVSILGDLPLLQQHMGVPFQAVDPDLPCNVCKDHSSTKKNAMLVCDNPECGKDLLKKADGGDNTNTLFSDTLQATIHVFAQSFGVDPAVFDSLNTEGAEGF
eukprot:gene1232-32575_t